MLRPVEDEISKTLFLADDLWILLDGETELTLYDMLLLSLFRRFRGHSMKISKKIGKSNDETKQLLSRLESKLYYAELRGSVWCTTARRYLDTITQL